MKKETQKLSKKEREAKDNAILSFKCNKSKTFDTAKRLLSEYNGNYNVGQAKHQRFTVNTIFSLVHLLIPNFIFSQPYLKAIPKNAKYFKKMPKGAILQIDNIRACEIREAALNHIYQKVGGMGEQKKAVVDALFYSYGITKVGYSFETLTTPDKDYIVKDSPFLKRVDPRDFGVHPLATGLDDSITLTHRVLTTKTKLKAQGKYSNLEMIIPEIPQHLKDKSEYVSMLKSSDYVTLYEVHDQENDMVYTFAGESMILIDKQKRGYDFLGSDFSMVKLAGDNDSFSGVSLLAMVEDEAMAMNEVLTLIMEHLRKYPAMIFANAGAVDEDDIERIKHGEQGSVHTVQDVNQLKIQTPLSMGADYFNVMNMLQGLVDRILGVPDFQRASSSTRKSATEASFIQGDATVRRDYYLQIVKDFMIDGITKLSSLQAQFQDEEESILASGELKGMPITYDKTDIQGDWQVDFDIDSLRVSDQAQANNLNQVLTVFGSNPIFAPVIQSLDPMKIGEYAFKKVGMNIEQFQTQSIDSMLFVPPEEENKIARKGEPMPAPKKGEDYEYHLQTHMDDIKKNGMNEEILNHIAGTMMLRDKELAAKTPIQTPQIGEQTAPESGAPMGPMQASSALPTA